VPAKQEPGGSNDDSASGDNCNSTLSGDVSCLHIFVDNSNIFLGLKQHEKPRFRPKKLDRTIATFGEVRSVEERWVAGSGNTTLRDKWAGAGYQVNLWDERTGPEVNIDESLQAQMWKALSRDYSTPHTLVLLTGDGNSNNGASMFPDCVVEKALRQGWKVEVWSWKRSTSQVYRTFAGEYASQFELHMAALDTPFYSFISIYKPGLRYRYIWLFEIQWWCWVS
jgi:hypothetical protein